jgi:tetratricopeptide (TPR) repeat protein
MEDEENKDAENLTDKKDESYKSKIYEETIKHYESLKLDPKEPKNASDFREWAEAIFGLAEIKQDEAIFKDAFEKYDKAATLEKSAKDKALIFYKWGNAISNLAEIKQDEAIFKRAFEKYNEAIELNPNCDSSFCYWGIAYYRLAELKKNEKLFENAFEKYDKATQLAPNNTYAFYNWGNALYRLARIKQKKESIRKAKLKKNEKVVEELDRASDSSLFKNAFEKYYETVNSKPDDSFVSSFREAFEKYDKAVNSADKFLVSLAYCNWGLALYRLAEIKKDTSLFESALEKYEKATQSKKNDDTIFLYWGLTLYGLAKIKQDEVFKNHLCEFEKATENIKDSDTLLIKGELYFILYQTGKNKEYKEKIKKYFLESKNDILEILTFLDEDNEKEIIEKDIDILYSLLDSDNKDSKDSAFFKETIEKLEHGQKGNLDDYKKVYVLSNFIISRLYVNNQSEKYEKHENLVAHYRKKEVSQRLLFENNFKFKLNTINYSNDPTEGKTLLDFLYGKNRPSDEKLNDEEYKVFGSGFTFDYDSSNQFRLYGKQDDIEGTGLSLVFRDSFFSKETKIDLESPKKDSLKMKIDNPINEAKFPLFRCIYIDPHPQTEQPIVTVGQKEEYLFYREKIGDKFEFYSNEIRKIIECIREKMVELRNLAKALNPEVVGQLLINLRYLTKHVAFKDEQECRIFEISSLLNDKIKNDSKRLYIEYQPKVSNHIAKIIFGPKATGFELFKNMLKNKKLNITCEKSTNPLA